MSSLDWASLTRVELGTLASQGALVLIPTGAIEQHGNFLSVNTDTRLANEVTHLAAARVRNVPVVVAPPVSIGCSPHHAAWPGTISLRLDTYLSLLRDIVHSVLNAGFGRVLFINGHGGNDAPLRSLVAEMVTDGFAVGMVNYFTPSTADWTALLEGKLGRAGHACEQETALMMALPNTSEETRAKIAAAIKDLPARTIQPWIPDGITQDPITAFGASWPPIFQEGDCGYYGDPAAATVENGERILEVTVERLAAFIESFSATPLRLSSKAGTALPLGK